MGKIGNEVYAALTAKKGESRILLTRGDTALALDPVNNTIYEYTEFKNGGALWCIPAGGAGPQNANDALAWIVSRRGQVALVNGAMKAMKGFPLVTGCSLSGPPAAFDGKLFLTDEDGCLYTLDHAGVLARISFPFDGDVLRSPPSFLEAGGKKYMAMYPKSFAGELWLSDASGNVYPGWPAQVSGIAFGSPLLFSRGGNVFAAFITQAGKLFVFDEAGSPAPGFPLDVDGVFHIQPVWDGESLWALSAGGVLHRIASPAADEDSRVLRQAVSGLSAKEGFLLTADPDGDGTQEIFFTGEANALYGYSRAFSLLAGFPLPVWGRPAFADFIGDGMIECVGAGLVNLLYRWQFNK
jgi:outer membrane protein assembly factor BamB